MVKAMGFNAIAINLAQTGFTAKGESALSGIP